MSAESGLTPETLLSFLSAAVAVETIVVGLAGVFAFVHIRAKAREDARAEATKVAEAISEKAAVAYLELELPGLIEAYKELARNTVSDEMANEIAAGQED